MTCVESCGVPNVALSARASPGNESGLRQLAQHLVARDQRGVGIGAAIGRDPGHRIQALRRAADDAVEVLARHVGDRPGEVAGRRLDQLGEIVGLDVEGTGIVQHVRELLLVERAVDQGHDGEIFHRLAREFGIAFQRRHEIARFHRAKRADVREIATAEQIVRRPEYARGIGMIDRMTAGQRHLAHGAQDGVALATADFPH
jgi:hypothetical protein